MAPTILALLGIEQPAEMTGKPPIAERARLGEARRVAQRWRGLLRIAPQSAPASVGVQRWRGLLRPGRRVLLAANRASGAASAGRSGASLPDVRRDPARLDFQIDATDGAARTGRLRLGGGLVETPAFVPLATRGSVRALSAADVAGLGFQMVLGNTFHLFLAPGEERIAKLGGLREFMGWDGAVITDSGGFQVFSLAHGNVADEVKGRRGGAGSSGRVLEISERGVRFRSYIDGSERFLGPEESMAVQAALGSDIALLFDECTPYHADYDYTARSTERTHRWLDRCLAWHEAQRTARARRSSGSSRAASTRTCGAPRRSASAPPRSTASRSAGPWAATRRRCTASWR